MHAPISPRATPGLVLVAAVCALLALAQGAHAGGADGDMRIWAAPPPLIAAVWVSGDPLAPGRALGVRVRTTRPAQITAMLVRADDTKAAAAATVRTVRGAAVMSVTAPAVLAPGPWRIRVSARDGAQRMQAWSRPLAVRR